MWSLVEHMPVGVYRTTPDGQILYVNKAMASLLGYSSPEALRGQKAGVGYVDPQSRTRFLELMERDGVVKAFEAQWRSLEGRLLWLRESARCVKDERGNILYFEGVAEDITGERLAREQLEASERRFRYFSQQVGDFLYCYHVTANRFEFLSPAFTSLTGYDQDSLARNPAKSVRRLIHPDDRRRVYRTIYAALRRRRRDVLRLEYRVLTSAGQVAWMEDRLRLDVDEGGNVRLVGVVRDITSYKEALRALQESQERFAQVAAAANEWIWEVDAQGRYTYSSPAVAQLLGYTPEEVMGRPFWEFIHPDEREEVKTKALALFSRGEPLVRLVNRLVRKDGRTVVVETTGQAFFAPDGTLLGYRGVDHDVTERVEHERRLRESEARYRELVERARLGILIDDAQGRFVYFNQRFAEMFGYEPHELAGLTNVDLVHPEDRERVKTEHQLRVSGQAPVGHYGFMGMRKDGQPIWVEVDAIELREGDRVVGTRSYVWDVTERVLAQRERERLIQELQDALAKVKTLSGLLPICASCKRIRDDSGYWHQVEAFLQEHSEVDFTHSICPECMRKLYPEFAQDTLPRASGA